jgi:hypothetical protein
MRRMIFPIFYIDKYVPVYWQFLLMKYMTAHYNLNSTGAPGVLPNEGPYYRFEFSIEKFH